MYHFGFSSTINRESSRWRLSWVGPFIPRSAKVFTDADLSLALHPAQHEPLPELVRHPFLLRTARSSGPARSKRWKCSNTTAFNLLHSKHDPSSSRYRWWQRAVFGVVLYLPTVPVAFLSIRDFGTRLCLFFPSIISSKDRQVKTWVFFSFFNFCHFFRLGNWFF